MIGRPESLVRSVSSWKRFAFIKMVGILVIPIRRYNLWIGITRGTKI